MTQGKLFSFSSLHMCGDYRDVWTAVLQCTKLRASLVRLIEISLGVTGQAKMLPHTSLESDLRSVKNSSLYTHSPSDFRKNTFSACQHKT